MSDPIDQARQELVTDALRTYGVAYRELSRAFAGWLGLHSTDAEALLEILSAEEHGEPISPARLSERIGRSHPATTAVLNRLERAGHIVRTREHDDRRVVTLRSSVEVQTLADDFFRPLGVHVEAVMSRYSAAEMERFHTFLGDMLTATNRHLEGTVERTPPALP